MTTLTGQETAALQESIRRLAAQHFDRAGVRESADPQSLDRTSWRALCDIGVVGMLAPASRGGLELGLRAAVDVWEECGYGLITGPMTWSALGATRLDGVSQGDTVVTGLHDSRGQLVAEHLDAADRLVILGDGIDIYDVADIDYAQMHPLDPLTPVALVNRLGQPERIGDNQDALQWSLRGACLTAASLVGATRLAIDTARSHVLARTQFGRLIGSFQSVKHLLADMAVGAEVASAAVSQAAQALDADDPDARRYVSSAKVLAGDAASLAARSSIQLHGGMGYTWEADPHLVWKRIIVWDNAFGDAETNAQLVAHCLGDNRP